MADDAGLLRIAKKLYGIANLEEFIELGERFRPFRTHAAWYLWASLDNTE
jgi:DNA-3-methyladenine glycosylase II